MWENDIAAERIPDGAQWEKWILTLSDGMREMLQMTAASVLAGLDGAEISAVFPPVPVSTVLTERIVSGGDMAMPLTEGGAGWQEDGYAASSKRQGNFRRQRNRTPYETARELQKQSELLLRT